MWRQLTAWVGVAFIGIVFGIVYRYFVDDPGEAVFANYLRSALHGTLVSCFGWGANLYFNARASRWMRTWPLPAEIGVRAVAMAVTIGVVIAGLQVLIYDRPFSADWLVHDFPKIIAFAFALSVVFGALFELLRLIGGRVLINVILGRYRHPMREERVLMFLDLAGSTSLAEALGELRMQELLTRFFFDIDAPIVAHGGEVHAYVGDEVIVTWPFTPQVFGGAMPRLLLCRPGPDRGACGVPTGALSARSRGFARPCTPARLSSANAAIPAARSHISATR